MAFLEIMMEIGFKASQVSLVSVRHSKLNYGPAIYLGLKLAIDINSNFIWIETYSLLALNLIKNPDLHFDHPYINIILQCRSFVRVFTEYPLTHSYREGNACADKLVKEALLDHSNLTFHHQTPFINLYILADQLEVSFVRTISNCNSACDDSDI
ncbi:putative ribonuclease h protein [Senna tora]|uniref:Putative ribonuclease h protein n=1 Tax=Senna tora TaxID=362788 RepID=A0A834XH39_9FABA|nr:putative ribonuclease h protein [Senna tora]